MQGTACAAPSAAVLLMPLLLVLPLLSEPLLDGADDAPDDAGVEPAEPPAAVAITVAVAAAAVAAAAIVAAVSAPPTTGTNAPDAVFTEPSPEGAPPTALGPMRLGESVGAMRAGPIGVTGCQFGVDGEVVTEPREASLDGNGGEIELARARGTNTGVDVFADTT